MKEICYAMIGSGRASELHLNAITKYINKPIRKKYIYSNDIKAANAFKTKYGFEFATDDFNSILNDEDVSVIDICTPPFLHFDMIISSLEKNKNVICEKPLIGNFDNGNVDKKQMLKKVLSNLAEIEKALHKSKGKIMYAENYIYAPAIQKAVSILKNKKSKILYAYGEESLNGSSSSVAGFWNKTGGGSLIRVGIHPLTAILYLKKKECDFNNEEFGVSSILADVGNVTNALTKKQKTELLFAPIDVEDFGSVIITFKDNTKAVIVASDVLLGGSKNDINLYCNNASIKCKLTLNDNMQTYFSNEEGLENTYISEAISTKIGWNNTFVADDIIRGYADEMNDFFESVLYYKDSKSNFEIAKLAVTIIYYAYYSAEQHKTIVFK